MTDRLEPLTAALIEAAHKAGAEAADAMALEGRSVTVGVRAGSLEQAERAEGTDIGLRVLLGGRQACVSASDTSADTIRALAERAVAMAREAPEDPHAGLADPDQLGMGCDVTALDLADPAPEPDPQDLQEAALEAEAAALAIKGVSQVQGATGAYGRRAIHMAATNGFSGGYTRTDSALYCTAIAGEGTGMQRDSDGDSRIFAADLRGAARDRAARGRTGGFHAGRKKAAHGGLPGGL
jgi:PmbA protein